MPRVRPLVAAAVFAFAVAPLGAAPDEAAYGAGQGYPVGSRYDWFQQHRMVGSFTAMEQLFPTRRVAAAAMPRPLPRAEREPDRPFVQRHLDSHPATGLLVMKDGRILVERYQYGRHAEQRFTSFSMAKTVVAMAVGVAVAEGRIGSVDDTVDRYEPALKDTAWAGVTLRQVLQMSSGVQFDETYDRADTDIATLSRTWSRQQGTLLAAIGQLKQRDRAPGATFKYVSAETQVLAQVLVRATGMPLADYVGEKLWRPMGAEADAAWVLDAAGMEAAYCCLSARLRDWARLGQLLLDDGRVDGRRVVPAEWVRAATTATAPHLQPRVATPYFGYGYQVWIFPDGLGFALLGIRGQAVFVNPRERLVMVQTAVWPSSSVRVLSIQRDRLWRDLVKAVARP